MEYPEEDVQDAYDEAFDAIINQEGLWDYDGTYDINREGGTS